MDKEREKIKLSNSQWCDLAIEEYLEDDNSNEVEIEIIENNYLGSNRHTESHEMIFKRIKDEKYFKIEYETSVKDSMGWKECNWQDFVHASEVFPKQITITKYV